MPAALTAGAPAAQVLALGDHAALLVDPAGRTHLVSERAADLLGLEASRLLGVPARYRVGYIYTGGNYENKLQSEASHAWVEVYLPFIGWRGLDPTNGCAVAQDHIRVACGRNYRDATPTSGTILKGGGDEGLMVHVKITEVLP